PPAQVGAKKTGCGHTHDCEWIVVEQEDGADHGGIGTELFFPRVIAQDRHRSSALLVVRWIEQPPRPCAHTTGRKEIARDKLAVACLRRACGAGPAHSQARATTLERSQFFERRRVVFEPAV